MKMRGPLLTLSFRWKGMALAGRVAQARQTKICS